jgi:hypothetical protein
MQRARACSVCAGWYLGFAAAMLSMAMTASAWAGGGEGFGPDEQDEAGHSYFGYVRDKGGNGVADAKLTVELKSGTVILRTNDEGHFRVNGFGASVQPDDVKFSCSKEGYTQFAFTKQVTSDAPTAPVEVNCILAPQ